LLRIREKVQPTGKTLLKLVCVCGWISDEHFTRVKAQRQLKAHKNEQFAGYPREIRIAIDNLKDGGLISEY